MLSDTIIAFKDVWKKYSKSKLFHKSLREDIASLFDWKTDQTSLSKDEFWALQGHSFQISKGEFVALYGPNGAGKSTILKLIANITYPNQGCVHVKKSVAPLIAIGAGFHPDLSGKENIYVNGAILGMKLKEINHKLQSIIDFSGIEEFIDMPVKKYSSGMHMRLAFSIAIHSEAEIYLFDEIIATGDNEFKEKCFQKITELKQQKKTILFVSHDLDLIHQLATRMISIDKGQIIQDQQIPHV